MYPVSVTFNYGWHWITEKKFFIKQILWIIIKRYLNINFIHVNKIKPGKVTTIFF